MGKSLKVLVTGGAGFIGSHMVDRLVKDGYDVSVLDNLSTGKLDNIRGLVSAGKVDLIEGDIRDVSLVRKSIEGVGVVIHFAAVTSVPFSVANPNLTFDVNLQGTQNLVRASAQAKVGKFVYISSCAVFGDPESLPVREEDHTDPISPYAETKLSGERYCLDFQRQQLLQSVVLRFFNVYGPRQGLNDYSGVITRFIDLVGKNKPLTIYGDGQQSRDFVNVQDIVGGVFAAMQSDSANGQIFNIGSGKATTINELAKEISDLAGVELKVNYEKARVGEIKHSYADISKAKNILGYSPSISLHKGLEELI